MSSAQDLFRQKRAEKGTSKPNWKELKAKKLQQQAQEQKKTAAAAAPSFPKPSPASAPSASNGLPAGFFHNKSSVGSKSPATSNLQPGKGASSQLPANFFQASAPGKPTPSPAAKPSPPAAAPAAPPQTKGPATTDAAGGITVVPKGFFANAEADAKVRGEKLPTKQDKEEEFKEFQKLIEEQINVAAQEEAAAAAEAAEDKEEREEFEQMMRLKLLHDLRSRRSGTSQQVAPEGEEGIRDAALISDKRVLTELVEPESKPNLDDVALPVAKRRRVIDVVREGLEGGDEEDSDEADDADDIESELLNWRAKTV